MPIAGTDAVRPFAADPDLLEGLDDPRAAQAANAIVARRALVRPGPWLPEDEPWQDPRGHLGLLVLDGLLVRRVVLAGRRCAEVLGPGDLLRPWEEDAGGSVESTSGWEVLETVAIAELDARVAAQAARFPVISARLLARSTLRARALVHQAAIAQSRRADTRLLLALWQLADRWGRVTRDGVVVPVPVTHQLLAELTCLARPTVSTTLGALADRGEVLRAPGGGWLLGGEPPAGDAHPRAHAVWS